MSEAKRTIEQVIAEIEEVTARRTELFKERDELIRNSDKSINYRKMISDNKELRAKALKLFLGGLPATKAWKDVGGLSTNNASGKIQRAWRECYPSHYNQYWRESKDFHEIHKYKLDFTSPLKWLREHPPL
jgi:hypothetical protein